mmetsp:Transcript_9235/g.29403  ORF Transcript_9235/g.29403 Transcript_9235/m.29403 type:complete len:216 (-) Transcript_9235:1784-2431(-)
MLQSFLVDDRSQATSIHVLPDRLVLGWLGFRHLWPLVGRRPPVLLAFLLTQLVEELGWEAHRFWILHAQFERLALEESCKVDLEMAQVALANLLQELRFASPTQRWVVFARAVVAQEAKVVPQGPVGDALLVEAARATQAPLDLSRERLASWDVFITVCGVHARVATVTRANELETFELRSPCSSGGSGSGGFALIFPIAQSLPCGQGTRVVTFG